MAKHSHEQQTRPAPEDNDIRARIEREREAAIAALRRLGIAPTDEDPHRAAADEGDEAQASERQDMGVAYRERLAARINRLTRALELLTRGTYGVCEICKNPIGAERLAAIPEVTTCRDCQERVEREAA